MKKAYPLTLFPAGRPLESVAINILGPLPKSKRSVVFILVIADRFTKLTHIVPLHRITTYDVAIALTEHWVLKYGPLRTLLSDNGRQFVAHLFQKVCQILGVTNTFTTTYHPHFKVQVKRFNRTLTATLRCYVDENPKNWYVYAPVF